MEFEGLIEKYQKCKLKNSKEAKETIFLMRKLVREQEDDTLYARFAYYEGEQLYYEGKMEEALHLIQEYCIPPLKKKRYFKEIIFAYNLIAIILQAQYEYLEAIDYYMNALDIASENDEHSLMGNIYNNISNIFEDCEEYERQLEYLHMSINEYEKGDCVTYRKMVTYINIASAYCRIGEFKEAERYYQEVFSFYREEKDQPFLINLLVLECSLAYYREDKEHCTKVLNQIIDMIVQGDINVDNFKEIIHITSCTSFLVDQELSEKMFRLLKSNIERLGYIDFELYLSEVMMHFYYNCNDLEKAKETALRYFDLSKIRGYRLKKETVDSIDNKFKLYQLTKDSIKARANLINLKVQSEMDPLTKLLNRTALETIVEEWFEEAIENQYPMAVEIVDVDYFKPFNDTYGHVCGDEALKTLADVMNRMQGDNLLFIRYGGDEFLAFYLNHDKEKVLSLAKLLKSEIRALNIEHASTLLDEKVLSITQGIYYGIPTKGDNIYDFIRKCDDSLYEGKITRSAIIFNERVYL